MDELVALLVGLLVVGAVVFVMLPLGALVIVIGGLFSLLDLLHRALRRFRA